MNSLLSILPDMGTYSTSIWSSYIITLGGLGALGFVSWQKKRLLEKTLKDAEKKVRKKQKK